MLPLATITYSSGGSACGSRASTRRVRARRRVDACQPALDVAARSAARTRGLGRAAGSASASPAATASATCCGVRPGLRDGRAERAGDAGLACCQGVDQAVRQRNAVGVDAVDPAQPRDGALDADRRVAGDEVFEGSTIAPARRRARSTAPGRSAVP